MGSLSGHGYRTPCGQTPVLLVGDRPPASSLEALLRRSAHPVRRVSTWSAALQAVGGMRVAVFFYLPDDLVACADRLRVRVPRLRVIIALAEADSEVEQLVMLREYLHLTTVGPNLESLHALIHDVLQETPSPQPTALPS